jgi:hypothetical protein
MKYTVFALIGAAFLTGCATPAPVAASYLSRFDAETSSSLVSTCLLESKWPLYNSPEYRQAGERRRSQMRNSPGSEVRDMQAMCWSASRLPAEATAARCKDLIELKKKRLGSGRAQHVERVADICERMTGLSIKTGT